MSMTRSIVQTHGYAHSYVYMHACVHTHTHTYHHIFRTIPWNTCIGCAPFFECFACTHTHTQQNNRVCMSMYMSIDKFTYTNFLPKHRENETKRNATENAKTKWKKELWKSGEKRDTTSLKVSSKTEAPLERKRCEKTYTDSSGTNCHCLDYSNSEITWHFHLNSDKQHFIQSSIF